MLSLEKPHSDCRSHNRIRRGKFVLLRADLPDVAILRRFGGVRSCDGSWGAEDTRLKSDVETLFVLPQSQNARRDDSSQFGVY